jgi:hypothetical protein
MRRSSSSLRLSKRNTLNSEKKALKRIALSDSAVQKRAL